MKKIGFYFLTLVFICTTFAFNTPKENVTLDETAIIEVNLSEEASTYTKCCRRTSTNLDRTIIISSRVCRSGDDPDVVMGEACADAIKASRAGVKAAEEAKKEIGTGV
ncbi:hypothetical protein [Lacinutrix undariae]